MPSPRRQHAAFDRRPPRGADRPDAARLPRRRDHRRRDALLGAVDVRLQLSLVGLVGLAPRRRLRLPDESRRPGPAGEDRATRARSPLPLADGDWPSYRADNRRNRAAGVSIAERARRMANSNRPAKWRRPRCHRGQDGVRKRRRTGRSAPLTPPPGASAGRHTPAAPCGFPPAIDQGRLFAGSGDGCVYAFEAASGKPLWRFQAAPVDRRISPLWADCLNLADRRRRAGGRRQVYCGAGIAAYDGAPVRTGCRQWQARMAQRHFRADAR